MAFVSPWLECVGVASPWSQRKLRASALVRALKVDKDLLVFCITDYCIIYYIVYIMYIHDILVVPHKAAAEVSRIGNLQERLFALNHEWHSEATDGPTGG